MGKKLLSSNTSSTCSCNMVNLRPTNGWDWFGSLGHPCKFQWVSRLGSVTAWHSSSGHQPNFAALNRGHHLYSAGGHHLVHWPTFYFFGVRITTEWLHCVRWHQIPSWKGRLPYPKLQVIFSWLAYRLEKSE